ncbi:MAG: discoidin domain-containing protein, partial [Alistipes sp.]
RQTVTNKASVVGANNVANISIVALPDGSIRGAVSYDVSAALSAKAGDDNSLSLVVDPALVDAYNTKNGTTYTAVAAADVTLSGELKTTKGSKSTSAVTVSMANPAKLTSIFSMIAVRLDATGKGDYEVDATKNAKYILITKVVPNIEAGATSIDGTPISDMTGWVYNVEGQESGQVGGFSSDAMFNGNNGEMGWYSSVEGLRLVTVNMAKVQHIIGLRLGMILGNANYATLKLYNIQTSVDGKTWTSQADTESVAIGAPAGGWQYVKFIKPVDCRYVRMQYNNAAGSSSNGWIGCCEFNAIAPKN